MKKMLSIIIALTSMMAIPTKAQIGYQVSLLNTATGEPRAGVTVNANITITDSREGVVHTSTQRATTNDFGVLSLTVGDANTFKNVDTGKLPLFIAVTVDGTLIGKSQILSVPVAEIANKVASSFTLEDLVGTWKGYEDGTEYKYTFNANMTWSFIHNFDNEDRRVMSGSYQIDGNTIWLHRKHDSEGYNDRMEMGRYHEGKFYEDGITYTKQ